MKRKIENRERIGARRLDANAGLAPMSPLGVVSVDSCQPSSSAAHLLSDVVQWPWKWVGGSVPDGVVRSEADPLGNWAVLLLRFGKLLLGAEGLVAL